MNVNEMINIIKEVALLQGTVKSVYDGDVYDNWNKAEIKYGSFNIGLQSMENNGNMATYTFILYYGDRLQQDEGNVNSIYSDGMRTIQSVLNILSMDYQVDIPEEITYTPFTQKFMDYLAGAYAQVTITTDSELGYCDMDDYEYTDDKERLIERLIEEINKHKAEDEQLAQLLLEILHKINGETIN